MIGVVAAKTHSKRFKNKNIYPYLGVPLFWNNVQVLRELDIDVYVATDSEVIKNYCKGKVQVIWRGSNINHDEQPIFDVLKYVHNCVSDYDIMISILANTINLMPEDIEKAVEIMKTNNLQEVRGYNEKGVENGLLVLKSSVFCKHEISCYVGAVQTNSKEIHYKEELE